MNDAPAPLTVSPEPEGLDLYLWLLCSSVALIMFACFGGP